MNTMTHDAALSRIQAEIQQADGRLDHEKDRERFHAMVSDLDRADFITMTSVVKAEINRLAQDIKATRNKTKMAHRQASLQTGSLETAISFQRALQNMKMEAHNTIQMRLAFKEWSRAAYLKRKNAEQETESAISLDASKVA